MCIRDRFKSQFDFDVQLTDFQKELEINPIYLRTKKIYKLEKPKNEMTTNEIMMRNIQLYNDISFGPPGVPTHINRSWCKIVFIMENLGTRVIEDWRVRVCFKEGFKSLSDDYDNSILRFNIEEYKSRTTMFFKEDSLFVYRPRNNEPLIQKDNKSFACHIIPNHETSKIEIEWELLARDFSKEGVVTLKNIPVSYTHLTLPTKRIV